MAGLNDDVEEGLISLEEDTNLTIVEDVLTNQTNPSQPDPEKIVLATKDATDSIEATPVSINELFGDSLIPGELPNLNAEFELIEEKRNTINDYEETSKLITGKNSISQEDAKLLDSILPGFINDNIPLGYFTKDSTKTFFNESVGVMTKTIDNEKHKVNDLIKNHLNNLSQHYSTLITGFDVKLKPVLLEQTNYIKNLLENEIIFTSDVSDNFLKKGIGLTDFLNMPIDDIDISRVTNIKDVSEILFDIKEAFKEKTIRSYFLSFQCKSNGYFISLISNQYFGLLDISLNKIINTYKNLSQELLITDIYLKLQDNEKIINNIRNYHPSDDNIYKTPEVFKNDIMSLTQDFNNINNFCKNLYLLNSALIEFLKLFKQ